MLILTAALGTAAASQVGGYRLSVSDDQFLNDLEHRSFLYFWEQAGPTGIIRDRAYADGSTHNPPNFNVGSAAATGFGLTAICIGADRGWIPREQALERVLLTLRFLEDQAPREHGWFYHWMDPQTGQRIWNSEFSSIDSALLLAGVLTAGEYFSGDPVVTTLALSIYDQVDFQWMLNGSPYLLSHGWTPESGFLPYRWDSYSELMILYALAIGSPTHPIPPKAWYAWKRPELDYNGIRYITGGPLFVHQYSQAWLDLRKLREDSTGGVDWFENSVAATAAERQYCYSLSKQFPSYANGLWGITASDSAMGYTVWGEPPASAHIDGTVVPSAPGGSLMFAPSITLPTLKQMYREYGDKIYKRYGFVNAFDPADGWIGQDAIGIDTGIILLSAENLRTGFIWKEFMQSPPAPRAMHLIGFQPAQPPKPGFLRRLFSRRPIHFPHLKRQTRKQLPDH
ncbi:MAG TPA: glucoamylase family protein [Bryobacteraceae bacterium]|nr:glucoamylase family protein [Bryobacteraceae bacterium]